MKILAVCAFGVGSSMILKLTIEKAAAELGVQADVENTDLASAPGMEADVIFTNYEWVDQLRGAVKAPIVPIRHYTNRAEVKSQLSDFLKGVP